MSPGNREIETKLDGLSLIMINPEFGLQSKIETLVRINLEHPPIHCSIEKAKIVLYYNSEQQFKSYYCNCTTVLYNFVLLTF